MRQLDCHLSNGESLERDGNNALGIELIAFFPHFAQVPIALQDQRPRPKKFWSGHEMKSLLHVTSPLDHLPQVGTKVCFRSSELETGQFFRSRPALALLLRSSGLSRALIPLRLIRTRTHPYHSREREDQSRSDDREGDPNLGRREVAGRLGHNGEDDRAASSHQHRRVRLLVSLASPNRSRGSLPADAS